ncbi:phthiocerol/phthiodiolone dimycocerosyl transferase family protein [Streptomyces sp. 2A115]|uniref:phthiocerol/phthiodiolone dimycocerosyl transferase family protein n=1 Tax=Streptomyces sp. 2A115 TaxID=3457439 RepID=UPI003FD13358
MTTAGMWRALTPTEKIYADKEIYAGYMVHAAGRLDPDALRTAYEAVCRAYPQLAGRLETGDEGLLVVESDTRPEVRFCDGDLEHPLTGVELDQRQALSMLNVVRDGDVASVTLLTHHSIADGHHSMSVLAALWSCYTDVVQGVPVDLPRQPFPRSLEDLLAERGFRSVGPAEAGASGTPAVTDIPAPGLVPLVRHVAQCRFAPAETTALTELCRREHVTVSGLLSGALLLVEAEFRDVPVTDLVLRFPVDLRQRLTPQIRPTEGANVVGEVRFRVTDGIEPHAVAIGRAFGEQLRAGLADGSIQRSLPDIVDMINRHTIGATPQETRQKTRQEAPRDAGPAVISMTNLGLVPPMRTPDDLRLTNFNMVSRIREAPAQFVAARGYVVSTFAGQLSIALAWPEKDAEQSKRLDCLRELLSRMTLEP